MKMEMILMIKRMEMMMVGMKLMMMVMKMIKMKIMVMIRKLFSSTNYVLVTVLSTKDTKFNKAALPILSYLIRTQCGAYHHSLFKRRGVIGWAIRFIQVFHNILQKNPNETFGQSSTSCHSHN